MKTYPVGTKKLEWQLKKCLKGVRYEYEYNLYMMFMPRTNCFFFAILCFENLVKHVKPRLNQGPNYNIFNVIVSLNFAILLRKKTL